jgi:Ca2+-binding EF-hand superfamily protein
MVGLKRAFQEMDLDGNHVLDFEEFSSAIVKCGLGLSHQDLRLLFLDFDQDGNGVVDWEEFMGAVRGELSPQRRQLIASLFDRINQDGTGVITITDIGRCFQPQHHPEVKSGNKDIPTLLSEFLDTWEALAKQGTINLDGFLEYYASVSSFLESDEDFEQMLSSLWNVPASRAPRRGASSLRNFAPEETKGSSTRTLASVSAGASLNHVQMLLGKLKEQLVF